VVVAPLIDVMALPQLGLAWETADFSGPVPPGTIVINTMERKLFFVLGEASVIRYPKHDRRASVAADHVGSVRRSFATRFFNQGRLKHEVQHRVILSVGVLYGQGIQAVIC
jgi:hypothetical protein